MIQIRKIGFTRLAIFRPGIIVGNAHTPAWVGWLGKFVPGPFGNIDQRILGRSIAAEIALHSRESGEVIRLLVRRFNSARPRRSSFPEDTRHCPIGEWLCSGPGFRTRRILSCVLHAGDAPIVRGNSGIYLPKIRILNNLRLRGGQVVSEPFSTAEFPSRTSIWVQIGPCRLYGHKGSIGASAMMHSLTLGDREWSALMGLKLCDYFRAAAGADARGGG